jgi:hypothetical protein
MHLWESMASQKGTVGRPWTPGVAGTVAPAKHVPRWHFCLRAGSPPACATLRQGRSPGCPQNAKRTLLA